MTTSALGLILRIGAAVVLAAVVAAQVAHSIGLPGLLIFLGLGLAPGEAGAGVRFDNAGLAQALGLSVGRLCAGKVPAASIWFPHRVHIATMPLRYLCTVVWHAGWIAQATRTRPGDAMSSGIRPGTDNGILALAEARRLPEGGHALRLSRWGAIRVTGLRTAVPRVTGDHFGLRRRPRCLPSRMSLRA